MNERQWTWLKDYKEAQEKTIERLFDNELECLEKGEGRTARACKKIREYTVELLEEIEYIIENLERLED